MVGPFTNSIHANYPIGQLLVQGAEERKRCKHKRETSALFTAAVLRNPSTLVTYLQWKSERKKLWITAMMHNPPRERSLLCGVLWWITITTFTQSLNWHSYNSRRWTSWFKNGMKRTPGWREIVLEANSPHLAWHFVHCFWLNCETAQLWRSLASPVLCADSWPTCCV